MASIEQRPGPAPSLNNAAPLQKTADYDTAANSETAKIVGGGISSAIEALPDDLKAFARAAMNYPDLSPAAKARPANPDAALERFVDAADKAVALLTEAFGVTGDSEEMLRALDEFKDDDPETAEDEEEISQSGGYKKASGQADLRGEGPRRMSFAKEIAVVSEDKQTARNETRTGGTDAREDATLQQVDNAEASVQTETPAVFSGGVKTVDTARILGRLIVQLAGLQRQEALESRLASRELVKSELFSQADKLRDAAGQAKTAAIVQGVMTIAFSAVSIGASAYAVKGAGKTISQMKQLNQTGGLQNPLGGGANTKNLLDPASVKLAKDTDDLSGLKTARVVGSSKTSGTDDLAGDEGLDALARQASRQEQKEILGAQSTRYQGIAGLGTALGGFGQSLGGLSASGLQEQSKLSEADAQIFAAEAEETRSEGDVFKEVQLSLDEMIKAMIGFLKELRTAEVEEMRAITKG